MEFSSTSPVPVAAVLGVASHWGYFIRGEHQNSSLTIIKTVVLLPPVLVLGVSHLLEIPLASVAQSVFVLLATYLVSLLTSVVVYRVFLHRLRTFPGPALAGASGFWHASNLSKSDNHLLLKRMHDRYGKYVRMGPTSLSITDPAAVELIYGARTKCTKGLWYDLSLPLVSLHQTRSKAEHDKRRRGAWEKAFTSQAVRDYEPQVTSHADLLVSRLASFAGAPQNATDWINYFAFDVMGALAFGKSFGMLQDSKSHWAVDLLSRAQGAFGLLTPVGWLFPIATRIPAVAKNYMKFVNWCEETIIERKNSYSKDEGNRDIASWLIGAEEMSNDPFTNRMWLAGDSRLIIVAGSDTTSATLSFLLCYLCMYPQELQKLREELKDVDTDENEGLQTRLAGLKHLNGAINESLRLNPPVPSGLPRLTPPEGLQVGGTWIPGEVNVNVPSYVMGRSEECYERPLEFIPERWYSKPEMVKRPEVFIPFSHGRYSCIGKQLALQECRTVAAKLINHFDIRFAPGEDGSTILLGSKDIFTTHLEALRICFVPRKTG